LVKPQAPRGTRDRVLAAASELFAERGFHGTTVRDIAARAQVNVAAGHYHYGSKKALYLAVLRAQFAEIRGVLRVRGASRPPAELARLTRPQLRALLRARVNVMLDLLIGPPPGLHGTLMHREMCDPSEALPVIVDEFIAPMVREMQEITARLMPGLDDQTIQRCVFSVTGQALYYRFSMPIMLRLLGLPAYPRGLARQLAEHIAEFSFGGMERIAGGRVRSRHAS
jgi:AcrR family transcriptional regulator